MQHRRIMLTFAMAIALMVVSNVAMAQYQLNNLTSNQFGQAHHDDPLIVNAWGLVHGPGTPWWISDNNSGWSTLYDNAGNIIPLKVVIPTTGNGPDSATGLNGPGSPTGVVFNATSETGGSNEFQVQGWSSIFLFATLDGTISAWAPGLNRNQSTIAVDNGKEGASYTGLAITNRTSGNLLYAANMAKNRVEVYDATFTLKKTFTDSTLPTGFAPFGIRDINGVVYVTFASTSGTSGGFVEQFKEDGTPVNPGTPLISGAPLNQPWGVAAAPSNFGKFSNTLLIGNNTNTGTINAFDPVKGTFVGTVKDAEGKPIVIDQLWGIDFGDGLGKNGAVNQLFFAAGPKGNVAGTLGMIKAMQ